MNKVLICFTTSIAIALLSITFLYASNLEPVASILLWIAVSILIGPFAPESVTGGDVGVGNGPELENLEPDLVESEVRKPKQPRGGGDRMKIEEQSGRSGDSVKRVVEKRGSDASPANAVVAAEEKEWTEEDFELLKKQMAKNPVGKARRWEVISEAFAGRHKVDSVVKMAKSMAERKIGNEDSYAQFLKHRKPLDSRAVESENGVKEDGELEVETGWSVGEDKALLNALKAFPKEVAMRWEKISAAVPGRSKRACMKRVADLKKDFRSSKAS